MNNLNTNSSSLSSFIISTPLSSSLSTLSPISSMSVARMPHPPLVFNNSLSENQKKDLFEKIKTTEKNNIYIKYLEPILCAPLPEIEITRGHRVDKKKGVKRLTDLQEVKDYLLEHLGYIPVYGL